MRATWRYWVTSDLSWAKEDLRTRLEDKDLVNKACHFRACCPSKCWGMFSLYNLYGIRLFCSSQAFKVSVDPEIYILSRIHFVTAYFLTVLLLLYNISRKISNGASVPRSRYSTRLGTLSQGEKKRRTPRQWRRRNPPLHLGRQA